MLLTPGEMVAMIVVLVRPPRESCSRRVNFDSLFNIHGKEYDENVKDGMFLWSMDESECQFKLERDKRQRTTCKGREGFCQRARWWHDPTSRETDWCCQLPRLSRLLLRNDRYSRNLKHEIEYLKFLSGGMPHLQSKKQMEMVYNCYYIMTYLSSV